MHYERYTKDFDKYKNFVNKWYDKILDSSDLSLGQRLVTFYLALQNGSIPAISNIHELELIMRALSYDLVTRVVKKMEQSSLVHLISSMDIGQVQSYFFQNLGEKASSQMSQGFRYCYHVKSFEDEGKRIYKVSPGLSDQLAHTELRGLLCKDLRLPYPALYIRAPHHPEFRIWNDQTGWHNFEGIYLVEDQYSLDVTKLKDGRFLSKDPKELESTRLKQRSIHVMFTAPAHEGDHILDDAVVAFSVELPDDGKLEEHVDESAKRFSIYHGNTDWRSIFRWAVNVIIYATWPDCEREHIWVEPKAKKLWERLKKTKSPKKRKSIGQQLKIVNQQKVILLGGNIRVNRSRDLNDGTGIGTGKSLEVQVRVSGHWKMQPHGPRSSLRKLIWCQPYWRGPENAPIKEAVHQLGGVR